MTVGCRLPTLVNIIQASLASVDYAAIGPESVSESSASERTKEGRKTKTESGGKARKNSWYLPASPLGYPFSFLATTLDLPRDDLATHLVL